MVRNAPFHRVPLRPPWRSRSARAWPRRPLPRSSTARNGTSAVDLPDGADGRDHHRRQRGRSPRAAPLDGARHGPGRHPAVPRRQVLDRTGDRERLLLRLRAARRQDVQRRRPRRDRGEDGRDHQGRSALRPRRGVTGRRAEAVRRSAVQVRDHRAGVDGCGRQRRCRRDRRR